jgi:hypothetical protein
MVITIKDHDWLQVNDNQTTRSDSRLMYEIYIYIYIYIVWVSDQTIYLKRSVNFIRTFYMEIIPIPWIIKDFNFSIDCIWNSQFPDPSYNKGKKSD